MNYLAHFHLADAVAQGSGLPRNGLLIGALLGDFVKGPLRGDYPDDWEQGIRLHRRIDGLTDRHPLTRECLTLLPEQHRRFGGIMLDLCFDHCLSRGWTDFHPLPLDDFNRAACATIRAQQQHFPAAASRQITILDDHDVLGRLHDWQQVSAMLARIGLRLQWDNPLALGGNLLAPHLDTVDRHFRVLYPQLIAQLIDEFRPT